MALLGAVVPFFISSTNSSSTTVNGVVTSSYSHDSIALGGGIAALVFGALTLTLLSRTPARDKVKRIGLTVSVLLLGAYQLVIRSGFIL